MSNSSNDHKSRYLLLSAHYVLSTVLDVAPSPRETKSGWATLGPQPRAQRPALSVCSTAHDAVNTGTLTGSGKWTTSCLKVHPRLGGERGYPVTLSKDHQQWQMGLRLSVGTGGMAVTRPMAVDPFHGLESGPAKPSWARIL